MSPDQARAKKAWTFPQGAAQALAGPLAWDCEGGQPQSRHPKFSGERGRLCWDAYSKTVVEVSDWMRDEYWGERVLDVWERLTSRCRGLHWERRQSDLVELGEAWQGVEAKVALHQMTSDEAEEVAGALGRAWEAALEAKALDKAARQSSQTERAPRL